MLKPGIASYIDLSLPTAGQKFTSITAPVERPVQITDTQVQSIPVLTKQLNAMNLAISQTSHAQRSHPEQAPITFKNVTCGTGGAVVLLQHSFGSSVEFIVTRWKGVSTVSGPSLVCDEDDATPQTDTKTLALRSYVAGVANIRVYPGG